MQNDINREMIDAIQILYKLQGLTLVLCIALIVSVLFLWSSKIDNDKRLEELWKEHLRLKRRNGTGVK
jgi:hypothetical protein